ncbi:aconitase X catalytic domain-containing protein [Vineibacter terrae]|uniref:aconitase X catalytic domain-containing protein n=1 Tax=Vineibacter terrae TaxID=2586908 RepID=UPI002E2EA641|nr:aconitase X catalytic domain-containing protein [Vineibacter terrae]HEX2888257.1 aconitase X catalytic domain-containing protein [Vineibacter terrae]
MVQLTAEEQALRDGREGPAAALALRIVVEAARMLGAERLVPIESAHIDGCLYHGDSGTLFAERLVAGDGRVRVPTTLNVGALDLLHPERARLEAHQAAMARRMMDAYMDLGCRPTWTCAPYQAGHRPAPGTHVAWGESNAVAFCNSVLGARSERYGDYLDICAALAGRAPDTGLHRDENRRATLLVDTGGLDPRLMAEDAFYPVLGAWLGATAGAAIVAIDGLPAALSDDRLKALCAAAAATGAVGLFHIIGTTPEAPDIATAFGGVPPAGTIRLTGAMLHDARDRLSTAERARGAAIDAIAIGSPHLSVDEFWRLLRLLDGRRSRLPFYACTGRHTIDKLEEFGLMDEVKAANVTVVADTCVVVTPILPPGGGVLLTNSGKFAHYSRPNTGYDVVYGSLSDVVETAVAGRLVRDETLWR